MVCLKSVSNMDAQNKISSDCYFLGMCSSHLFTFMDLGVILGYFGGWKGNTVRCIKKAIYWKGRIHLNDKNARECKFKDVPTYL